MSRTVIKKIERLCARSAVSAVSVTQRPSQSLGCVSTFSIKGRENPCLNLLFDPNVHRGCVGTLSRPLGPPRYLCVAGSTCTTEHDRSSLEAKPYDCIRAAGTSEQDVYFETAFKLLS